MKKIKQQQQQQKKKRNNEKIITSLMRMVDRKGEEKPDWAAQ